jgi:hypothetical protein
VSFWRDTATIPGWKHFPPETTAAGWVFAARENGPETSETRTAWGRVWLSSSPWWGISSVELLALRLWPTRRSWIGWLAQSAISLGMGTGDLLSLAWHRLIEHKKADTSVILAHEIAVAKVQLSVRSWPHSWPTVLPGVTERMRDLGKDLASFMTTNPSVTIQTLASINQATLELSREGMKKSIERKISPQLITNMARVHAGAVARGMQGKTADFLITEFGLMPDLASVIAHCVGFAGTRAAFAHSLATDPLTNLLRHAARHSLDPSPPSYAPPPFEGDPLWPALARHIGRCSTEADYAYLIERIRYPDSHPEASEIVRWGLRYWVGGDVMLADGSILTLDELWAKQRELHPEHAELFAELPWLEDQPPDMEIELAAIEKALANVQQHRDAITSETEK